MSKSEQEVDELVSPDNLMKVFGIPRGSVSKLIINKGFPRPIRVFGEKRKYYLASQVWDWLAVNRYVRKQKKKVSEKPRVSEPAQKSYCLTKPSTWRFSWSSN